MTRISHVARLVSLAVLLAFPALMPLPGAAQAVANTAPLVTIRFNQSRVYFDQQLYSAIAKAVSIKPEVMFDVVSCAPSSGNPEMDRKWQATAGRNTRSVVTTMNNMGVPMSRINVIGQDTPGLRYDETRVFVR